MKKIRLIVLLALVLMLAAFGVASAQQPAYNTQFITSITFQNVGTGTANVVFQFYGEGNPTPITVQRTLNAGAGSSLFVGGLTGSEALPANFLGSAVMSSNQPVVATLVQSPQSTTVKNRPLSNGFSTVTANVGLATVLKNQFGTTSKFSIQNADSSSADVTVIITPETGAAITLPVATIPSGAARYFDMGTLSEITAGTFNGSATATAVKSGTSTPANIVGSVVELATGGTSAAAFEGVSGGSTSVYMATALCDAFGSQRTAYAVQNVGNAAADITVTYSDGTVATATGIAPGAKKSFTGCTDGLAAGFSGAATITSGQPLVVIGKAFGGGVGSAFLGEPAGTAKLALPYVRWSEDAAYNAGTTEGQRAFVAIQNVSNATVTNVEVQYRDKNGTLVGTHTIASIEAGKKANSTAIQATPAAGKTAADLLNFGFPKSNPGGGYGGGATIVGPAGSQLIAVVRVASLVPAAGQQVAEDYNGIPVQ